MCVTIDQRTTCTDEFFHCVGSWDQTPVIRLWSKHPYLLSCLTSPAHVLYFCISAFSSASVSCIQTPKQGLDGQLSG